ncbi:hypothetical protein DFH06DRAFT_1135472 [Mycena polygramma]|nr:hypothetical protein DFH06DRAFT_1135472 [Mycena polygramma]
MSSLWKTTCVGVGDRSSHLTHFPKHLALGLYLTHLSIIRVTYLGLVSQEGSVLQDFANSLYSLLEFLTTLEPHCPQPPQVFPRSVVNPRRAAFFKEPTSSKYIDVLDRKHPNMCNAGHKKAGNAVARLRGVCAAAQRGCLARILEACNEHTAQAVDVATCDALALFPDGFRENMYESSSPAGPA